MSRFYVKTCLESDSSERASSYTGPTLVLANAANDDHVILFPVNESEQKMILYMLDPENEVHVNDDQIGVFKTLVESWSHGDRFLSGIFLDEHDGNVHAQLIISGLDGEVDSVSSASFHQAVILSAYQKIHIHMSERLIEAFAKHMNEEESADKQKEKTLTKGSVEKKTLIDHDVLKIAKQIMLGEKPEKPKKQKASKDSSEKTATKKVRKKT